MAFLAQKRAFYTEAQKRKVSQELENFLIFVTPEKFAFQTLNETRVPCVFAVHQ